MKRLLIFLFILLSFAVSANDGNRLPEELTKKKLILNRRDKDPAGFNLYLFGPVGLAAVSFDYFVTPKISLELGGGLRTFENDYGFTVGGRYHFFGKTPLNITPYIGVFSGFEYTGNDLKNYNLYIPFGLQRIKKNHFNWSLEVAYQRNVYEPLQKFYGGIKIGYRF